MKHPFTTCYRDPFGSYSMGLNKAYLMRKLKAKQSIVRVTAGRVSKEYWMQDKDAPSEKVAVRAASMRRLHGTLNIA